MSIAVIGSLTQDRITIAKTGEDYCLTGGGVLYSSFALASLGSEVLAMPALAQKDETLLQDLQHPAIHVTPLWTADTTTYCLNFPNETMDVCEKARPTAAVDVTWSTAIRDAVCSATAVHISPLSPTEFDIAFFKSLRHHFKGLISLDGQGFVRGELPNLENFLPGTIDILKCDDTEILQLTQARTESEAVAKLKPWGIAEILVTRASKGSTLYYNNETHPIVASTPQKIVDATGCGDSYIAGYLHQRVSGATPVLSAEFASQLAAKNLEHKGALR